MTSLFRAGACDINESELSITFHHNGAAVRVYGGAVGDALTGLDSTVQIALEILRRVLAAEVTVALASVLHSGETRVLADLPVGVGALRPRYAVQKSTVARPVQWSETVTCASSKSGCSWT